MDIHIHKLLFSFAQWGLFLADNSKYVAALF